MTDELRVLQEHTDPVLATTEAPFIAIDSRGRIVSWNAAAERAYGWSFGEVAGQTIIDFLVAPWAREQFRPRFT